MRTAVGSVVAFGLAVAGAGLLGLGRQDTGPVSVAPLSTPPAATVEASSMPTLVERNGAATETDRERALFREIVTARRTAQREAGIRVAPLPREDVLLFAPSTVMGDAEKGTAKRSEVARRLTEKSLARLAVAHGMTRDEINDVYRRGRSAGWPTVESVGVVQDVRRPRHLPLPPGRAVVASSPAKSPSGATTSTR